MVNLPALKKNKKTGLMCAFSAYCIEKNRKMKKEKYMRRYWGVCGHLPCWSQDEENFRKLRKLNFFFEIKGVMIYGELGS